MGGQGGRGGRHCPVAPDGLTHAPAPRKWPAACRLSNLQPPLRCPSNTSGPSSLGGVHGIPKVHFKGRQGDYYIMVRGGGGWKGRSLGVPVATAGAAEWLLQTLIHTACTHHACCHACMQRMHPQVHILVPGVTCGLHDGVPATPDPALSPPPSTPRSWTCWGPAYGTCGTRRGRSCRRRWWHASPSRRSQSSRSCTQRGGWVMGPACSIRALGCQLHLHACRTSL